jgi:hypothetical protein
MSEAKDETPWDLSMNRDDIALVIPAKAGIQPP